MHKGLPTIEATRHSHPVVAAKLLQETGVSEVLVGDPLIEMRQAKQLIDFCKHRHFTLCIEEVFDTTVTYLFDMCHKVRPDNPGKCHSFGNVPKTNMSTFDSTTVYDATTHWFSNR